MDNKRRVLITNASTFIALDLARLFSSEDIEVFVADSAKYHICSFSNSLKKKYLVPSPRFEPKKYINKIIKIIKDHDIDLVIPVYEEIFYIAKELEKFPKSCKVLAPNYSILESLNNKYLFQKKIEMYGFQTPNTYLLKSKEDLLNIPLDYPFMLKACYCRASQRIKKINSYKDLSDIDISFTSPWIAQEWLEGKKYCTYSLCDNGKIKAHATYPVEFSIDGNSCLTFHSVEHEAIFKWVKKLVALEKFSGQIGFDFVELPANNLYAIECNPRATSGIHLLSSEKEMIDLYFGNELDEIIKPNNKTTRQIATAMLMYGWRSSSFSKWLKKFIRFKDIIFNRKDIKPFLFQPFLFAYYYYRSRKLRKNFPSMFTHDSDWNGNIEYFENLKDID